MPRTESSTLTEIFAAYQRRDWLDLYKSDESVLNLSRGRVVRNGVLYDNYIASVEELNSSIDTAVDRVTINCQNVNSLLGFNLASNLRLLDYAVADYGKFYQSARNPALTEEIDSFRGVLANAEVDETRIGFELIADYDSIGAIIAARNLNPLSAWRASNGIEVTATGSVANPKTGADFIRNGKEWEFGGWEFFEEPTSDLPGAGGNDDVGIGGGYNCFSGATLVWTPDGFIQIRHLRERMKEGKSSVFSFDPKTGEIFEDEILEIFEHPRTIGFFTLEFDHKSVNVTPEHPFLTDFGRFKNADDFKRNDTTKVFQNQKWSDSILKKIKWNSDKTDTSWNIRVKKFPTYFANGCAVHNKAISPYEPNQY